jgi:hypothetical protein
VTGFKAGGPGRAARAHATRCPPSAHRSSALRAGNVGEGVLGQLSARRARVLASSERPARSVGVRIADEPGRTPSTASPRWFRASTCDPRNSRTSRGGRPIPRPRPGTPDPMTSTHDATTAAALAMLCYPGIRPRLED